MVDTKFGDWLQHYVSNESNVGRRTITAALMIHARREGAGYRIEKMQDVERAEKFKTGQAWRHLKKLEANGYISGVRPHPADSQSLLFELNPPNN